MKEVFMGVSKMFSDIEETKKKIQQYLFEQIGSSSLVFNEEYVNYSLVNHGTDYQHIVEMCVGYDKRSIQIRYYFDGENDFLHNTELYIWFDKDFALLEKLVKHIEQVGAKRGVIDTMHKCAEVLEN